MKQPINSPTFCVLPWVHINGSVGGKYRPCCNSEIYFSFDDDNVSIKQAFESSEMDEVRQYMAEGKEHPACEVCYSRERNDSLSFRHTYTVDKFKNFVDPIEDEKVRYFDLRFDNTCNLACRMCDPSSSNLLESTIEWYQEQNLDLPNHWKKFNKIKQKDNSLISNKRKQYVIEILPNVRELKVTGGEPFISKDFLEVLDYAIEKDYAKNIRLLITTNGTKFVKSVLDRLTYFRALDMNISVDGCNETYEYIRYPFTWNKWSERFREFIDFCDNSELYKVKDFRIRTSTIVTSYNWLNCPKLYTILKNYSLEYPWLKDINYIPRIDFNLNLRPADSELAAKWLPDTILEEGLERWKLTDCRQVKEIEKYVSMSKNIDLANKIKKQKQCKYITTTLDEQRNQSYQSLGPEIKNYLDNINDF